MGSRTRRPKKAIKKTSPDSLPFSEKEREIFVFCDNGAQCHCKRGEKKCRRADPMRILFALWEDGGANVDLDIETLKTPIPEEAVAKDHLPVLKRLVDTTRKVLGVEFYDEKTGHGLTFNEIMKLLFSFMNYVSSIQKKIPSSQTSATSSPPFQFPSKLSATKEQLDSGSTSPAPSADTPPAQPQESELFSEPTPAEVFGQT